jgi:hypothetical protein
MPCSRSARGLIALTTLVVAGAAPAPAPADVLGVYERLAELDLSRAPLVPTTVPASLRPIDETIALGSSLRRGGYAIRLVREGGSTAAVIALEGGTYASMRQARSDLVRRQSFRARATRVRGHAGLALTRRRPTVHGLVWREGGVVYWMATGTARTVSRAELRATASGLDALEHGWVGSGPDPNLETGAVLVTTRRTVSGSLSWGANCTAPDGSPGTQYAGSVDVTLLPRSGDRFAFDLAGRDTGSLRWSGSVSGTVASDAVTLTIRATGTFDGNACDTGAVQVRLTRRSRG